MNGDIVDEKGIEDSVNRASSAVREGRLAEKFVQEREKLIGEDVAMFEEVVERCEEYVIMERMALLVIIFDYYLFITYSARYNRFFLPIGCTRQPSRSHTGDFSA